VCFLGDSPLIPSENLNCLPLDSPILLFFGCLQSSLYRHGSRLNSTVIGGADVGRIVRGKRSWPLVPPHLAV
jgi:hypothetical protein